jgi:hypothetical protein
MASSKLFLPHHTTELGLRLACRASLRGVAKRYSNGTLALGAPRLPTISAVIAEFVAGSSEARRMSFQSASRPLAPTFDLPNMERHLKLRRAFHENSMRILLFAFCAT